MRLTVCSHYEPLVVMHVSQPYLEEGLDSELDGIIVRRDGLLRVVLLKELSDRLCTATDGVCLHRWLGREMKEKMSPRYVCNTIQKYRNMGPVVLVNHV